MTGRVANQVTVFAMVYQYDCTNDAKTVPVFLLSPGDDLLLPSSFVVFLPSTNEVQLKETFVQRKHLFKGKIRIHMLSTRA